MKVLAVTSRERSELLPAVPTMAEAALPGYEMPAWRSIMGPGGMRPEVVQTLSKAMARGLANPDVRKRYEEWAGIFGRIARETGLKPQ